MAHKLVYVDDISGEAGDDVETVTFSYNGRNFEMELGPANRAKLEEALEPFIEHAVEQTALVNKAKKRGSAVPSKEIRAWAVKNGHDVSPRGVIHKDIIAAYNKANGTSY